MSDDTLFGAPLAISEPIRDQWIGTLTRSLTSQIGHRPRSLRDDLNELAAFFGTGAKPKLIRDKTHALPPEDDATRDLPDAAVINLDGAALITPEGRVLLEVLLELQRAGATNIGLDRKVRALETALELRAEWHATWLRKQFEGSLSAPALGAALFLIVNGSVGEERALLLPKDVEADRELGAVVLPVIAQFSTQLGGQGPDADAGIRQHWAFTQISRLLGRDVARESDLLGTLTFVRPGRERALLSDIDERLQRLQPDPHLRRTAVMAFIDEYRRARGVLAALGQMHEEPTQTRRILDRLADPELAP